MKVLVTGANGYIGKNVVKWLLDNGNDVLAADINLDKVDERSEKLIINLFENTDEYLEKFKDIDVCIRQI